MKCDSRRPERQLPCSGESPAPQRPNHRVKGHDNSADAFLQPGKTSTTQMHESLKERWRLLRLSHHRSAAITAVRILDGRAVSHDHRVLLLGVDTRESNLNLLDPPNRAARHLKPGLEPTGEARDSSKHRSIARRHLQTISGPVCCGVETPEKAWRKQRRHLETLKSNVLLETKWKSGAPLKRPRNRRERPPKPPSTVHLTNNIYFIGNSASCS